jgi:hypothetical protein
MKVVAKLAKQVLLTHNFAKQKSRLNFSQRTHPIHSIGPKTHVLVYFGPFRYCTKVDAKLADVGPLTRKFAKRSGFEIFHNECTQSTQLGPKLMF